MVVDAVTGAPPGDLVRERLSTLERVAARWVPLSGHQLPLATTCAARALVGRRWHVPGYRGTRLRAGGRLSGTVASALPALTEAVEREIVALAGSSIEDAAVASACAQGRDADPHGTRKLRREWMTGMPADRASATSIASVRRIPGRSSHTPIRPAPMAPIASTSSSSPTYLVRAGSVPSRRHARRTREGRLADPQGVHAHQHRHVPEPRSCQLGILERLVRVGERTDPDARCPQRVDRGTSVGVGNERAGEGPPEQLQPAA
ncbi:MAG: hypothetical protein R3C32_07355 [Chloroflexota bacterium]